MFSSDTISRDFLHSNANPSHHTNFKHVSADAEFSKSREFMPSDFFNNQQQHSSGLARYRSAPSSLFAALLDSNTDNNSSSGDESDAFFSALIERDLNPKSSDHQISSGMKREDGAEADPRPAQNGYDAVTGSYSVGMEHHVDLRLRDENGNRSNLLRQSSSPAGFFNGFGVMGEAGDYRVPNPAEDSSSVGGLSSSMNLTSAASSSSRFMPSIPETGNQDAFSPENGRLRNEPTFQHDSWNETSFNSLKRNRDGDSKMFSNFNGLDNENGEARKKSSGLVSHFSLPKTSTEMAAVENFLQFQQETTVPCQVRAKRGFATHPRSIAERNRRTRISKNMKKLQDLFPNMDKQTNTADMLDLAVDYIKELKKEMQVMKQMHHLFHIKHLTNLIFHNNISLLSL
ncbi:transcription factor bHLH130-like isoform X2 [Salvia miltiorrhiza]|uniref:transcription factor bHLH130-like isoform X2 n=1 Tax=Salvia miltiorrhiza TaxID=226208 RepID=UPI0025ABD22A|nr:transcription factor bHLH130-like isoform X2 [Salvia miltiorrhiza]